MRIWCVVLLSCAFPVFAMAQDDDGEFDERAPDRDWVWEDGYTHPDGRSVDGFYRVREKKGFVWQAPAVDAEGRWVEPGWRPVEASRAGFVWVHGHRGADGYWIDGAWRAVEREGYEWVDSPIAGDTWDAGYWRPRVARPNSVWVPGHWTRLGHWSDGFWREPSRAGYAWSPGAWRYGVWHRAGWKPTDRKADHVWVRGYVGPKGWVDGAWRPSVRAGHYWYGPHWKSGVFVAGAWRPGARAAVVRRHVRPHPVRTVIRTRAAAHRVFKVVSHPGKTIKVVKPKVVKPKVKIHVHKPNKHR